MRRSKRSKSGFLSAWRCFSATITSSERGTGLRAIAECHAAAGSPPPRRAGCTNTGGAGETGAQALQPHIHAPILDDVCPSYSAQQGLEEEINLVALQPELDSNKALRRCLPQGPLAPISGELHCKQCSRTRRGLSSVAAQEHSRASGTSAAHGFELCLQEKYRGSRLPPGL